MGTEELRLTEFFCCTPSPLVSLFPSARLPLFPSGLLFNGSLSVALHIFFLKKMWKNYARARLTLFRMEGHQKGPPTSFSLVTSTNKELIPLNFLTFIFNPFSILVWNLKVISSASPKLLNSNQYRPSKKVI